MSSMIKQARQRANLLQGTLDMVVLRTLLYGPAHGHQIGKHIQKTTSDLPQMQHGSLYPALHRLEERGWVADSTTGTQRDRPNGSLIALFYSLKATASATHAGPKTGPAQKYESVQP